MTGQREPGAGAEVALIAVGVAVIGAGFSVWLGARVAVLFTGGSVDRGLDTWLRAGARLLAGHQPDDAWGTSARGLPAGWLYWTCTVIAVLVTAAACFAVVWCWRKLDGTSRNRRRFGQETEARQATRADIGPLVVDDIVPPTGRMLLGRLAGHRQLLATEDRTRHPLTGRASRRQGNRGSVALIGPTGSGKTALATSAIATWDGPVVAVSVKRDLYDSTAAVRARKGDIAVFDPGAATNLPSARWTPLNVTITSSGALRAGRALAQAIPRSGVSNADYWAKHGENLLGAFMCIAGLSRLVAEADDKPPRPVSMEQLAAWVTVLAVASEPTINRLLRRGLDQHQPLEVKLLARHAATTFAGVAKEDHKIRSSIYSTAALALAPWLEPSVAHSATDSPRPFYWSDETYPQQPRYVDLEWLMAGDVGQANTLYLTASQPEFERLSPVLGGLLADLKDTIHSWDISGRRLDKPLLLVVDEAGQLELGWLPAEVSTIAGLGAFFVTCWQNLSQVQHRYNTLADAVLSGHRTKCFFAGVDDLSTVRYLSGLLGHEYVTRWSSSRDIPSLFGGERHGRRSVSQSAQREEFAPANALRQMYPGEAVLLHGTLPPIHLDAVRWWNEKKLAGLVPLGDSGNPQPPDGLGTCPLSELLPGEPISTVDPVTLAAALAQLPEPDGAGRTRSRTGSSTDEVADAAASPTSADLSREGPIRGTGVQRVRCEICGGLVRPQDSRTDRQGRRSVTRCWPTCIVRQGEGSALQ
ncbi:MAG: type IV secretory system conjugative DNA transfer family protein [Actinomycetota bacterium]|nr:type IV secretory system conjugative DNA transfer family protein [Actinomycetota bacterium]